MTDESRLAIDGSCEKTTSDVSPELVVWGLVFGTLML